MNNELKKEITKLNKTIKGIDSKLLENIGNYTDLKLHDILYKFSNIDNFYDIFENFCYIEFSFFNEFLEENDLYLHYIGNTRSFYINSTYKDIFSEYYPSDWEGNTIEEKLYKLITNELNLSMINNEDIIIKDNQIISVNTNYIDEEDIKYLNRELKTTIEVLQDILDAYSYIEDFKENQCDVFRESLCYN